MPSTAFDTYKAVKALKKAGFEEVQAEAVVATVGEAVGENVATKANMAEIRTEIAGLRADVANDFKVLYRHLWIMAASIVGAAVALVKLIP
ncbi:MAG: hypothetical protein OXI86_11745 [Candidatus Poribacteria bacterium]|nr:hypothetical protein [Candidatus Poribacteria bacterium]